MTSSHATFRFAAGTRTDLHLGAATIKTHIGRLLMKLVARDRAQLVVTAYETRLVTPGD